MAKDKQNNLYYFLTFVLILTGTAGGGYFCCISALLSIILMMRIVYQLLRTGLFCLACDINLAATILLVGGDFFVSFWAIDSGMSLVGGVKFLPVFLYFFILCQALEQKERLIRLLPFLGSLMTLLSFVMMQFPAFQMYVSAAGRLAGFFQYPNTYALFMLVCMLVSICQIGYTLPYKVVSTDQSMHFGRSTNHKRPGWIYIAHTLTAMLGIYLSGSRTVIVLSAMALFILLISKKEMRKYGSMCIVFFTLVILGSILCGYGKEIIGRLIFMSENASTFWGRLLYDWDAIKMIIAHPFGMGYYGYYFMQQEMQTGVYSVVNVHNEFFQIMLDIGIVPALVIYGAIFKSLLSKSISARNRLILLVMTLHSLFDYDFQFLMMYFVLLLFLEAYNIKQFRISVLTKTVSVAVLAFTSILFMTVGVSDFFYIRNEPKQAVRFYGGNTMAGIALLEQAGDAEEMEQRAEAILENNRHVSVAYSAKARAAFSKGDVETFVQYKLIAIRLAPYQYEEYTDYLECLAFCAESYLREGDVESAAFCMKRAEEIPGMLKKVEERTSSLGWKIKDRPKVTLSDKELTIISEMGSWIENYD